MSNTGPVPNFFHEPPEVIDAKALDAAFSAVRDEIEAGVPLVSVLRAAIAHDAHSTVRAIVQSGSAWQEVHQPDENACRQFTEAVEALAAVQAKAKAASLAALDKIAGDA